MVGTIPLYCVYIVPRSLVNQAGPLATESVHVAVLKQTGFLATQRETCHSTASDSQSKKETMETYGVV
jgi:hypothetical protein